ncbi:hypothetical protein KBY55_35375 [Streptomyces sp. b94]|nr:hypothetical protein [Streptomyces sp. b94]
MTPEEPQFWLGISHRLHVPFHEGVISQFDGYEELAEFDWRGHRSRYPDLRRLDRILEREGDHPRRYRLTKQADTLMLGHLFTPQELMSLLQHMGYSGAPDIWQRTVDHYLPRTTHGSTLSAAVHAHVLDAVGHPAAAAFRRQALRVDMNGNDRNGTSCGVPPRRHGSRSSPRHGGDTVQRPKLTARPRRSHSGCACRGTGCVRAGQRAHWPARVMVTHGFRGHHVASPSALHTHVGPSWSRTPREPGRHARQRGANRPERNRECYALCAQGSPRPSPY